MGNPMMACEAEVSRAPEWPPQNVEETEGHLREEMHRGSRGERMHGAGVGGYVAWHVQDCPDSCLLFQ